MSDFVQGVLIGGGFGVIVGVLAMACSVSAAKREEAREQAQSFMAWADTAEFNDRAREFNARAVRANRQAAEAKPTHRLQIMRAEYDAKQGNQGGTW